MEPPCAAPPSLAPVPKPQLDLVTIPHYPHSILIPIPTLVQSQITQIKQICKRIFDLDPAKMILYYETGEKHSGMVTF